MAAPATPVEVDGITLTSPQRDWLSTIIGVIVAPDPLRTPESVLTQALRAFRKVHKVAQRRWIRRAIVQLGTGPTDAVLVLPEDATT